MYVLFNCDQIFYSTYKWLQVLKTPTDPKVKKTFDDKVRELEKELETAAAPVREKLALQPTKPTPLGVAPPFRPTPAPEKQRPAPTQVTRAPFPVSTPPEPNEIPTVRQIVTLSVTYASLVRRQIQRCAPQFGKKC